MAAPSPVAAHPLHRTLQEGAMIDISVNAHAYAHAYQEELGYFLETPSNVSCPSVLRALHS